MTEPSPAATTLRRLTIAGWIESASLVVLLVNLATAHVDGIAAAVGPVHGTAYLISIAICWFGRLPLAARLWCIVPGVGSLIAARAGIAFARGNG